MSEEKEEVVRRFQKAFAAGDTAGLQEIVAKDVVDHTPRPGQPPGRQSLLDAVAGLAAGFPDLDITVEQVVAEGDLVVQYGVMSGTNSGEWMGIPATNRPMRVRFMPRNISSLSAAFHSKRRFSSKAVISPGMVPLIALSLRNSPQRRPDSADHSAMPLIP